MIQTSNRCKKSAFVNAISWIADAAEDPLVHAQDWWNRHDGLANPQTETQNTAKNRKKHLSGGDMNKG